MTKKDTIKFVKNIGIGAVAAFIIFLLVCWLCPATWTADNKILCTILTSWVLAFPGALLSLWLDKKKEGDEWDGGLSVPGAWGSLAIGSGVVCILLLITSWML